MKNIRVFLGGTCANNHWRETFIREAAEQGIDPAALFNPVVQDWNDEARQREEVAKAKADYHVYYLAAPYREGHPLSAYSMVEAAMAPYDRPDRVIVIFDYRDITGAPLASLKQMEVVLRQRFPQLNITENLEEAVRWVVDKLSGDQ